MDDSTVREFYEQHIYSSSSSSSDDDDAIAIIAAVNESLASTVPRRHGGSVPGHVVIDRGREEGHTRLVADYFATPAVFGEAIFRRR